MDTQFGAWKKALDEFKNDVDKELKEIRRHKRDIQQITSDFINEMRKGRYVRDDQQLILSAPEVIIGNVDPAGNLYEGQGSTVIIRGTNVDLDGVGEGGAIDIRATTIRQTAVDPGSDGQESVVWPSSQVVSQARHIVLQSNKAEGYFTQSPHLTTDGCILIHADQMLSIDASVSSENTTKRLDALISALERKKESLSQHTDEQKKALDKLVDDLEKLLEKSDKLSATEDDIRANYQDVELENYRLHSLMPSVINTVNSYKNALSQLAETNRQLKSAKKEKDTVKKGDDYKQKLTGASIAIIGESMTIASADGDGNLRDNEGAGLFVLANDVRVAAIEDTRQLKEKGHVSINAMNIELNTADNTDEQFEDGKLKSGTYEAKGDVVIKSKNITMESVDYELKDDKMQEKALTKDGTIQLRAEKMDLSATDTEGKAAGSLAMNAKALSLRSMDVEKEKRTDDKLAADSTMLLLSEKMYVGAKSSDIKSKKLQAVAEEIGLFADKTLEAQQGDGKGTLQLADGKTALGGSENQVYGKTTINAATEVKAELKAPKATIDNVEAKSAFKSPNISDGMAVGAAGGGGSLSPKLKAEDAPKE